MLSNASHNLADPAVPWGHTLQLGKIRKIDEKFHSAAPPSMWCAGIGSCQSSQRGEASCAWGSSGAQRCAHPTPAGPLGPCQSP